MKKTVLRKYANLIAKCGVNVQKGQDVEILAGLETKYHRARQAQITDELIEIISGTESQRALEKKAKK